jgi:hypothetical protein
MSTGTDSNIGSFNPYNSQGYDGFFSPVWDMIKSALSSLVDILQDIILWAFSCILEVFLYIANSIEVPEFFNTLPSLVSQLPSSVSYILNGCGFPQALSIIGSGMAFYVLRKLVTLGHW